MSADEYRRLVTQSVDELRLKTEAHERLWGIGEADWSIDQDAGIIVFTKPIGFQATASAQIIGTYNTDDGTWLWGWDHASVVPALHGMPATSKHMASVVVSSGW